METTIIQVIIGTISAVIIILLMFLIALEILGYKRGDADILIDDSEAPKFKINSNNNKIEITVNFNFLNRGKQQGLIIDAYSRIQPIGDTFKDIRINTYLINKVMPRLDGYWETYILKTGKTLPLEIQIEICNENNQFLSALSTIKTLKAEIYYKYYCRNPLKYQKYEFELPVSELKALFSLITAISPRPEVMPQKATPIKTHLLTPGEDIIDIINTYISPLAEKGDIVIIAESALAIIQKRLFYVEDIKYGFWSRKINKLFDKDSSLSSLYSLEMAFREVGVLRILFATAIGITGKLIGRRGDFYRIAGKDAATIDDCAGTIPPFDKHVVMGPKNARDTVFYIKEKLGLNAAVVDANDLKKVDILATTCPEKNDFLIQILIDNPQGNSNEQTPFVLIKL